MTLQYLSGIGMTNLQPLAPSFKNKLPRINHLTLSIAAVCLAPALAMTVANAAETEKPQLTVDSFMQCAELKLGAARLACYDKTVNGQESTVGRKKYPLDLSRTVKASFSDLRPTPVIADDADNLSADGEINPGAPTEEGNARLAKAGVTVDDFAAYTPLSLAYDLDQNSELGTWRVRPHDFIYFMPAFAHFDPNRTPHSPTQDPTPDELQDYGEQYDDSLELKAQISLKTKVAEDLFDTNADLWFGYTQQMHWQVYNEKYSRPFRATDYMPEIFITQPVRMDLPFNGRLRMLGAGAIHHSNGQSDPLSRSWNRLYLMGGAEWGKLTLVPKVWTHIKDSDKGDNPDITDYYAHGELKALYNFGRGESLAATGRYNIEEGNGAIELNYTYPITRDLHGFFQIFHGYGESIIDYNDKTTAVGVGISLNDWKGL